MPDYYVERIQRMLRLAKEHDIIHDGDRIIELGTGWLHWEAITLRLFYDIRGVLYDVWDNRQFAGLKNYFTQLGPVLNNAFGLPAPDIKRAQSLIQAILAADSFDRLYNLLGFEYVIESNGSLHRFPDNTFNLLVSAGVLEHVNREALPTLAAESRRILRPGGWAIHSIDTSDHLAHYDTSVSKKKYLSFSEWKWKLFFENEVQYINRVQRGDWIALFRKNGFDVKEEECKKIAIDSLKMASRYEEMERRDLQCTVVRLALKNKSKVHDYHPSQIIPS
jgi:SAM-dependent methyltransferase